MSRGFVKEGDQDEIPFTPPRAALPPGITNYVTPNGYRELLSEKISLEEERKNLPEFNEAEYRSALIVIDGKLKLLLERINSARILDSKKQAKNTVRFGAVVEFFNGQKTLKFQIVGVDEADIKKRKIAFTSPIAKILIGKKVNETAILKQGSKTVQLTIKSIVYLD